MKLTKSISAALVLIAGTALTLAPSALAEQKRDLDRDAAAGVAVRHLQGQRAAMRLPDVTGFSARQLEGDDLGQTHVRVDQLYRGVKVFEGELIVHLNEMNDVLDVTDDAHRGIAVDVAPTISEGDAIAVAHRDLAPMGAYNVDPTSELVVFRTEAGADVLAYHVHTELENLFELEHTDFMIDARSGAVVKSWDSLETTAASGSGKSQYSGTVALSTNSISGGYELRDMSRGTGGNTTRNFAHKTSGSTTIYTDADNAWGDSANYVEGSSTTAANGETAAVDAHYGLQKTWDYFKVTHGRNGIDNAGTATSNRVHYSNSYDNAFWSDSCFCMTYGDGSGFTTLTAIDVAGHEMTHGVTSRTARLTYSGESGGLNEASSDIFGTMVEYYARGTGNYTIGEQLRSTPLRYMYKPSLDGKSPNCYTSSIGSLNVHYSSGVANRFFYILAEGSAGSSPTCNGLSVTGIGRSAASKIYYRALTVKMTSGTNYKGARTACLSAATDLYGTGSANYNAVAAAWSAVGVN
ncbi:MAG: M4 family metallopeptidase [Thermoanaerobaculia bacterium]